MGVTMNDTILSVNFSVEGLTEKFWARIEVQPPESDFVSLSDAATVIDSIYDVDPCSDDSALVGGGEATTIESEYVSPLLVTAFSKISYDPCKYSEGDYSYEATLYIYRSHFDIPYKLVINDGTILSTEIVEKTIKTLVLPEDREIEVDYPILGNIECDQEIESFVGAQALLKNYYTKNLAFSYTTKYDKVTIKVNGAEEAQDAECLIFYKELSYRATVSKPEEDTDAVNTIGCNPTSVNGVETEDPHDERIYDDGICYQRYIYSQICQCSGNVKNSWDTVVEVACPTSPATPHSDTEQGALNFWWEAKHINTYTPCPEEEDWEGHESEFYIDNCCVFPTVGLPTCQERTTAWLGGTGIVKGADFYHDNAFQDETIVLVPVSPEDGICGTIKYVQDVASKSCCDSPLATPIVYDEAGSADIIGDNSSGMVQYDGGLLPATAKLNGSGFFTDPYFTKKEIEVTGGGRQIRIYTKDACGSCSITINDGCSSDSGVVKSTEGKWVTVALHDLATNPSCCGKMQGERVGGSGTYNFLEATSGDSKFRQTQQNSAYGGTSDICVSAPVPPVNSPCPSCPSDIYPYEPATGGGFCNRDLIASFGGWNQWGRISADLPYSYEFQDDCGINLQSSCYGGHVVCDPSWRCYAATSAKVYRDEVVEYKWRC